MGFNATARAARRVNGNLQLASFSIVIMQDMGAHSVPPNGRYLLTSWTADGETGGGSVALTGVAGT